MLYTSLLQSPAETTRYMIAGYAVIFTIMILYVVSLNIRRRNLEHELDMLKEMDQDKK